MPAICCLEVATLVKRGRISLDRPALEWMLVALAATAILESAVLVTKDDRIRDSTLVRTIWA